VFPALNTSENLVENNLQMPMILVVKASGIRSTVLGATSVMSQA